MLALLAAVALASPFAGLDGHWRCEGRLVRSGKPIASQLAIATDRASGVLLVHHDDTAPMAYHDVEVWSADPDGHGLHAAVSDSFNGLRVFRSPLMQDGAIVFSRPDGANPVEQFRYTLKSPHDLQIDWSIARPGQPLKLGDTLHCRSD